MGGESAPVPDEDTGLDDTAADPPLDDTAADPAHDTVARQPSVQAPARRPTGRGYTPSADDTFVAPPSAIAHELEPESEDDSDTDSFSESASGTGGPMAGRTASVRAPGWDQTMPPQPPPSAAQTRARQRPDSAPELKPDVPVSRQKTEPPPPPKPPGGNKPTDRAISQAKVKPLTARVAHSPVDEAARELARAALAAEIEKEEKEAMRSFQAEDGEIPPSPEVAKRFDVILQLGRGGMGIVYLCRDPRREGKVVAVKDIRAELKTGMKVEQRVEHEARLLKELDHPGIVKVYDFLKFQRGSAIVMEFIDGLPLDHEIGAGRRITWDFGVRVLKAIGLALGYAHDKGVIHRDIKPDNILYSERHGVLKLLDFGLARIYDDPAETHLTRTGMVVGTPHYMSPEQVSGKVLDQRSDIYSFGATLYYLITGQRHVDGSNVMDILEQQRSKPIIPPGHLRRDIPPWVSYIIGKMMEIKPDDRFESMSAVLDEVARAEKNPDAYIEKPPRGPVKRFNGQPLSLPGAETSHQARMTEPIRTDLPGGTGITKRKATARQQPEKPPVLVPPAATSTQRTRAAAHAVLELLGEDEQVSLAQISGALKDISARLEQAEKRSINPGTLVLLVVLSALVVVLGVVGVLLWLARIGALSF